MPKILVCDVETGSLDYRTGALTEVAAIIAEHSGDWNLAVTDTFVRLIQPTAGLVYTPEALEIQRRTMNDLQAGVPEYQALADL